MIYVISKSTFGKYDVHDIQCNANWCNCPYSDYALIPSYLVDAILATQGYCDITLNNAGTEVVAYTARSIPNVPKECCGVNTVLSVNGVTANADGEVTLTPADIGASGGGSGGGGISFYKLNVSISDSFTAEAYPFMGSELTLNGGVPKLGDILIDPSNRLFYVVDVYGDTYEGLWFATLSK